jgi:hypothetical protein
MDATSSAPKAAVFAIDTETSGKDPRSAILYDVSLAVKEGQAFYVPMMKANGLRPLRMPDSSTKPSPLPIARSVRRFAIGVIKSKGVRSVAQKMRQLTFNVSLVFDYLRITKNSCA